MMVEHDPNKEEPPSDDEDKEAISSIISDLDSLPMTPASMQAPDTPNPELVDDGVFLKPQENVGQRTRSKLSLSATPLEVIEQSFIPPDITCDMYDSACDNDDWHDFLKEFCQPLDAVVNETVDDVEADPEYNVLADADAEKVDKEELRVDRAVKISRKEVNALMAELREYTDMMSSDEEDVLNPSSFLPLSPDVTAIAEEEISEHIEIHINKEETVKEDVDKDRQGSIKVEHTPEWEKEDFKTVPFTFQQECLLSQQMRQHVQLMTQHFLQTYKHPNLHSLALKCKEHLSTLYYLGEGKKCSYFRPSNIEYALKTVFEWETLLDDPEKSQGIMKFMKDEINKAEIFKKQGRIYNSGNFPREMMELVLQSKAFLYPLLLPPFAFRPLDRIPVVNFTTHENMLIALCLEQFTIYIKNNPDVIKKVTIPNLTKLIVQINMPHCKVSSLISQIYKMKKDKAENPIKYYFDNSTAPIVQHFIVPLRPDVTLRQQPQALLPEMWRNYLLKSDKANYTNR